MLEEEIDLFFGKKPSEVAGYQDFQDMKRDVEIILRNLRSNGDRAFLCTVLAKHYNDDAKIDGIRKDRRKIVQYFEKRAEEYEGKKAKK